MIDHDELGEDGLRRVIEGTKYPNWCIHPKVIESESRDVEWDDDHPLNQTGWRETFEAMFAK